MLTVFLVSGGTGETAEAIAHAALAQFSGATVNLVRCGGVRTEDGVRGVVQEAKRCDAIVLHSFVSDTLRDLMLTEARLNGVEAMDVLGPVLDRFAARLELTPLGKPGLSSKLEKARQREIEAVDFAFRHDDGQHADELDKAEVVLVGISRSMKTPTMLYLAYRGWFAANVPIVQDLPLPASLLALPAERVFCLTMSPNRLRELRVSRARDTGIPVDSYASLEQVRKELFYSERLREKHGWQHVDVTAKSVEEVSREIIAALSRTRTESQKSQDQT